jgi:hypothetical protein
VPWKCTALRVGPTDGLPLEWKRTHKKEGLVAQGNVSWNRIAGWLQQMNLLRASNILQIA